MTQVTNSKVTVIVGGGHAGGRAAAALRAAGRMDPIIIVGEEPYAPYERPPLSKSVLSGMAEPDATAIHPCLYYSENGIDLKLNTRVERISPETCRVWLQDGTSIAYHQLLLCTGARPRRLRIPGAESNRVTYLRTRDDAVLLRQQLTKGKRLAVIGGGLIGLEVAATASKLGCDVCVFEADDILLRRLQVPTLSELVHSLHQRHGVHVVTQSTISSFAESPTAISVRFDNGTSRSFDLVLAGIGVVPETGLAERAGIACADGILVNEYCETSIPGIFAAGDVARRRDSDDELNERLETWQNAEEQASAAAASMTGQRIAYRPIPYIWTDQFDTHMQFAGRTAGTEEIIERGKQDNDKLLRIFLCDDKVVAVLGLNSPRDFAMARRLIGANTAQFDRVGLDDERINLKSIVSAYLKAR
ncbi:MAG: FAD-dependent oxidoreductase [Rhodospirillales bacterium]